MLFINKKKDINEKMDSISEDRIKRVITKVNNNMNNNGILEFDSLENVFLKVKYNKLPYDYVIAIDLNPSGDWKTPIIGWVYNKKTDDELCIVSKYTIYKLDKAIAHILLSLKNKMVKVEINRLIDDVKNKKNDDIFISREICLPKVLYLDQILSDKK